MPKNANGKLIQCGDHSWAPWSIVCIHLMTGLSRKWIPKESDSEMFDWFCPACWKRLEAELGLRDTGAVTTTNMRSVCIHCVRFLRERYDPAYVKEDSNVTG
jgi:hypothetical protein